MSTLQVDTYDGHGTLLGSATVPASGELTRATTGAALRDKAAQALAGNITYLALGSPTNVQVAAQVAALTRQVNALIRLEAAQLDSTQGT